MLKNASPLSQSSLSSRLEGSSMLSPGAGRHKRAMNAGLLLTSLVDAFSILVIFLIMNHSTNQEVVDMGKNIKLPTAMESQTIDSGVSIRIEDGGRFFVEEKEVGMSQLISTLKKLNASATEPAKKEGIVIVADRNLDYADLSPVILAGSQSGFTKFKFAVVRKD
jgi:biopolymer transport protein ExbD